jgi:hypothetical protein
MKMKAMILAIALPMLRAIGVQLEAADSNSTGTDDIAGVALEYSADCADAVINKRDIPYPHKLIATLQANGVVPEASSATTQPLPELKGV